MKSTIKTKFALLAVLAPLILSACTPAALRPQSNALVNVQARPAGPGLLVSSVRSDTFRTPGPSAIAVRADRNAFVSVILLPNQWQSVNRQSSGAVVVGPVTVAGGVTTEIGVPSFPNSTQAFVVASVEPLNLGGAQGATSARAVSLVVEAAAKTIAARGYNVTGLEYQVKDFGTLTVDSNVPGARVRVDDRDVGTTPFVRVVDVPAGDVPVSISRPGFQTWTRTVNILPNTNNTVYAELRRAVQTGTLTVSSSVNASVYVQGQAVGQVGAGSSLSVRVPAGRVSVTVTPLAVVGQPTLNSAGTTVLVAPDGNTSVTCAGTTTFVCSGN